MRKLMFGILVAFSVVSVSFGVDLCDNEENYQKLKAEVEMWDDEGKCKLREDGTFNSYWGLCKAKNVLAFFDEIRATEVEKEFCVADLKKAVKKVREMPRFKNDSSLYAWVKGNNFYSNNEGFWESVWQKWDKTKLDLEIRGIKGEYWKAVKRESE